jgi:hypothetical protein
MISPQSCANLKYLPAQAVDFFQGGKKYYHYENDHDDREAGVQVSLKRMLGKVIIGDIQDAGNKGCDKHKDRRYKSYQPVIPGFRVFKDKYGSYREGERCQQLVRHSEHRPDR